MAQLNVEIDDALIKKVKYACLEDGINLKKQPWNWRWTSTN
jgi:hypothetical protein